MNAVVFIHIRDPGYTQNTSAHTQHTKLLCPLPNHTWLVVANIFESVDTYQVDSFLLENHESTRESQQPSPTIQVSCWWWWWFSFRRYDSYLQSRRNQFDPYYCYDKSSDRLYDDDDYRRSSASQWRHSTNSHSRLVVRTTTIVGISFSPCRHHHHQRIHPVVVENVIIRIVRIVVVVDAIAVGVVVEIRMDPVVDVVNTTKINMVGIVSRMIITTSSIRMRKVIRITDLRLPKIIIVIISLVLRVVVVVVPIRSYINYCNPSMDDNIHNIIPSKHPLGQFVI